MQLLTCIAKVTSRGFFQNRLFFTCVFHGQQLASLLFFTHLLTKVLGKLCFFFLSNKYRNLQRHHSQKCVDVCVCELQNYTMTSLCCPL